MLSIDCPQMDARISNFIHNVLGAAGQDKLVIALSESIPRLYLAQKIKLNIS
jgi:hypothetical protein